MRDLIVSLIVFGSLPLILWRPWIGIIMWSWLGYMNPHRLTWGFAYDFPFAMLVAICTLAGLLFTKERRAIPFTQLTFWWLLMIVWMNVTTFFCINPERTFPEWDRTMKIQLMTFVTMVLIHRRQHINWLVWTIAGSIAFFGIKGGVFAFRTGAEYAVRGPMESFIEDNNALALALIMVLPLMRYLQLQSPSKWIRLGLSGAMVLCGLATLATQSRGALLAGSAMLFILILRSRGRLWLALAALLTVPFIVTFMPQSWFDRMGTISTYQEDASAMGRINAWWFAWNLAKDRPLVGGGFNTFDRKLFPKYAPDPKDFHDAHSNYFEMLAEHGFPGLIFYLILLGVSVLSASRVIGRVRRLHGGIREGPLQWVIDLMTMVQVGIVGYAIGGAFLGLAYYDLYYHLIAFVLILHRHVGDYEKSLVASPGVAAPSLATPGGAPRPALSR